MLPAAAITTTSAWKKGGNFRRVAVGGTGTSFALSDSITRKNDGTEWDGKSMLIRLGYELVFQVPARTPMLLMLYTHPSRAASLREADVIHVEPDLPVEVYTDPFGNHCGRIVAPPGKLRLWNNTLIEDSGEPDEVCASARQQPVENLPPEVLPFLLGSRYCEVDKLTDVAWSLFGQTPLGWPRVQAVCDWVHRNVEFGYQFASPFKSAADVYRSGRAYAAT